MENTQQRNSRIAQDDAAAHSTFNHAIDFFRGLATYEITQNASKSFSVIQKTPHGQRSGWAKDHNEALQMVEEWKNEEVCCGYSKKQLGSLV
jgi:hypothetical protein